MARARSTLLRVGITAAVIAALVLALGLSAYECDFYPLWTYRALFLEGLLVTLTATLAAYGLGLVFGVVVALARLSRTLAVRHLGDLYVETIRGTPFLVQVSIAYFGVAPLLGISNEFLVGAVTLGLFAAAYIGEIFRAGIESIDRGQFEAARSLGLSRTQSMRHVVFPQAFKRMIPPLTGELIALTKESSLLFYISVTELLYAARQAGANSYRNFEAFLVVAVLYLTITVPLSFLARRLERRLGKTTHLGAHL
jgi:polar amino acid transport system permease protein